MADRNFYVIDQDTGDLVAIKLSDNGDGSYSISTTSGEASAGSSGTFTNRSGTITSGGTAQQLAAENADRRALFIQNLSTGDLYVAFGTTAVTQQPSIKLIAGAILILDDFITTQSVSIIGATTGQAFTALEG